jgi:hypothetical protein
MIILAIWKLWDIVYWLWFERNKTIEDYVDEGERL